MHLYAAITKTEDTPEGLIVEGIASTEAVDSEDEVVDYDSLKAALPDYLRWGNVRAMHQPIAAGVALAVTPDDERREVRLRALVTDADSQHKVKTHTYKGFSIGGKAERKAMKREGGDGTYTRAYVRRLNEISLVDRPANPDASFTLVKMEAPMSDQPDTPETTPQSDALQRLAQLVAPLTKASSDPTKIVTMIQAARNEAELAGDMDGAALMTQAIALIQQASGDAEPPDDAPADTSDSAPPSAGGDVAAGVQLAAKPTTLRKAGRAISSGRMGAMHTVVKTLLQLMADAGDAQAQKAVVAYGGGAVGSANGDALAQMAKTIGDVLAPTLDTIAKAIVQQQGEIEQLKKQPASGGPQLRSVAKLLGTQQPEPAPAEREADILKRAIDDEPNPLAKTALRERLVTLELRSKFGGR